jgi:virginiamycin A acetyltransferase
MDARTARLEKVSIPDPNVIFPVRDVDFVTYVRPTITNKNIVVGDFTYFSDTDFEKHVIHHYDFYDDKLIIGKFCQIASNVSFVMNGANHLMDGVSTFPFYIFEGWEEPVPSIERMPHKGDTIIGNDVWIGQNSTILPGIHIGDGSIIGMNSTVGSNVEPYSIVVGNPAHLIRKRFDNELIGLLLQLQWWDKPISEIKNLVPLLHDNNLEKVKAILNERIKNDA